MLIKQIYLNTHMGISISSINYAFNHVNAFEIHDGSLGLEQNRQYRHEREQVVSLELKVAVSFPWIQKSRALCPMQIDQ